MIAASAALSTSVTKSLLALGGDGDAVEIARRAIDDPAGAARRLDGDVEHRMERGHERERVGCERRRDSIGSRALTGERAELRARAHGARAHDASGQHRRGGARDQDHGLARLVLVAPRFFPDAAGRRDGRLGAAHLLTRGTCSRDASTKRSPARRLAIAITARRRELSHARARRARGGAVAVEEARRGGEVALVFGTEMSGLANDEVIRCQRIAHIATNPDFSSLNLAAAVQVMAYEVRSGGARTGGHGQRAFRSGDLR